jgi:hypothetical protein
VSSDDPDAVFFEDPIPLQSNKAALREPTAAFFESVSDFPMPKQLATPTKSR